MVIKEIWKAVKGFEGIYEVSNRGRVKSLKYGKERILKPQQNGIGYFMVDLCYKNKKKRYYVHRLVWETFNGPIPKGLVINHKSEIKKENNLDNLELVTNKENANYGTRNLRISQRNSKSITLINASTSARYSFPSGYSASRFFGYKTITAVSNKIALARKLNKNKVKLTGENFYYKFN